MFEGRGAIVTGAASGIGRGIAQALVKAGARVALVDADAAGLERARAELGAAHARVADVADDAAMRAAAEALGARLGKVHYVFNNAGIEWSGTPLEALAEADWDRLIGVNVYGVIHGIRHFVPLVRRHGEGGHVVNTASIGGFQVNREFRLGPYSMTKYAVVALSEALEQDLEGTGIGVSVLCPAAVDTRIWDSERRHFPERREPPNPRLRDALAAGMHPNAVGERALAAIRAREFYVFTHRETKAWLERRFRRILDAYDRLEEKPA